MRKKNSQQTLSFQLNVSAKPGNSCSRNIVFNSRRERRSRSGAAAFVGTVTPNGESRAGCRRSGDPGQDRALLKTQLGHLVSLCQPIASLPAAPTCPALAPGLRTSQCRASLAPGGGGELDRDMRLVASCPLGKIGGRQSPQHLVAGFHQSSCCLWKLSGAGKAPTGWSTAEAVGGGVGSWLCGAGGQLLSGHIGSPDLLTGAEWWQETGIRC